MTNILKIKKNFDIIQAKIKYKYNAKSVRCTNTDTLFESIADACRWCGLNEGGNSLREYLNKGKKKYTVKHPETDELLKWEFVD